ncbi:MAG: M3 family metallopeptidase [Burkholderiales bacterium]|nr:M3 family metallopeptidase [Burkholderiales bacterium]
MKTIDRQFIKFNQLSNSSLESLLIDNLNRVIQGLEQVKQENNLSWYSLQHLLYNHLYELNQIWGLIGHLESVNSSQELRDLRDKYQNQITRFYVNLGQSTELYHHLTQIKQTEYNNLEEEDKKIIDNEFRDFKLSGIELNPQQQDIFKNIQERLTELTTKFEQNVLDATDSYSKFVTEEELNGMPPDLLSQYKYAAINDNKPELYKITLHMPSYFPIMEHCQNRQLREELYYHYTTRASELSDAELNNSPIITDILRLRNEKAKLLGFEDFTELSLYTKMANSSAQVLEFLDQLNTKSHAHALEDFTELSEFAKTQLNLDNLQAWDIPFVSQKLQMHKYSYSNWELKQYFQLHKVLEGLFKLIFNLYKIEFKLNETIPTWNSKMLTYEVLRDNIVIGSLYLDLFARAGKQPGAWMNSLQDKFMTEEIHKQPMAGIMCNFTPPGAESDIVILTFDEVQTLFHEMGHALHHLLTKINHFSISGINGVEWDAVELPSQFMEYFTWNREILTSISCHVETNKAIPDELYTKMMNARYYQSGLMMARQLEFAILDIMLHKSKNFTIEECYKITEIVRKKVAVIIPPEYNRFLNSFSHIFAGGYASGYYSYKWAEVLAADIFHKFDAIIDQNYSDLGQKFYNELLSQGGLKPMLENFVLFVGREPQIDALLKYSGID